MSHTVGGTQGPAAKKLKLGPYKYGGADLSHLHLPRHPPVAKTASSTPPARTAPIPPELIGPCSPRRRRRRHALTPRGGLVFLRTAAASLLSFLAKTAASYRILFYLRVGLNRARLRRKPWPRRLRGLLLRRRPPAGPRTSKQTGLRDATGAGGKGTRKEGGLRRRTLSGTT